jgi:hypothetical protein
MAHEKIIAIARSTEIAIKIYSITNKKIPT